VVNYFKKRAKREKSKKKTGENEEKKFSMGKDDW